MDRTLSISEMKRRELLKAMGLGAGALALGNPMWAYAQSGKILTVGSASNARPIYGLALYYASQKILKPEMSIAVQEKTFSGFVPSFAAMARGDVNFSYQTLPALTRAIKRNFAVKGFLGYVEQFVFSMVARTDIKSFDDLITLIKQRAKTAKKIKIASHSPASQAHIAILVMLREKGIDPDKDVEIVFISGSPRRLAALKANSIDATVISTSRAIEKAMQGQINVLANMSDFAPQQSVMIWMAGEKFLKERPDDVLLLSKALIRSFRDMYKVDLDELTEFALKQKPYSKFKPHKAIRETIKAAREMKLWPVDGGISEQRITTAQKFLVDTGFMKKGNILPVDRLVTTEFRDKALKELGPA